jgi:hypothetical protein
MGGLCTHKGLLSRAVTVVRSYTHRLSYVVAHISTKHMCALGPNITYPQVIHNLWSQPLLEVNM